MPGLLDRVNAAANLPARVPDVPGGDALRFGVDAWVAQFLMPSLYQAAGVQTTWTEGQVRQIQNSLPGYSAAVRECPPAFAAQMFRSTVLSQARFTWRNLPGHPLTPRRTFGNRDLGLVEHPWPKASTGDLVALMEWHAGLAGNAFVYRQTPKRLRVLRPDWVALAYGSDQEPEYAATALDGKLVGYLYFNGGQGSGGSITPILPDEMCHWAPLPNPETTGDGLGESWITAAVRDIQGDVSATEHKLQFWRNAGTPNLVVKGLPGRNKKEFDEAVDLLEAKHRGTVNAHRTLYLAGAGDAFVVGSSFKDMDLKAVQGAGETRIAMLGRVPATLLGISEGLAGSSLNAGNFGMARRIFGDGWVHPTLQDLARSLESLLTVPKSPRTGDVDSELWPDTTDMPLLREDAKDAADIIAIQAGAIRTLVDGGFDPEDSVDRVTRGDLKGLVHTGNVSVQLQPPGASLDAASPNGNGNTPAAIGAGK